LSMAIRRPAAGGGFSHMLRAGSVDRLRRP
jgi:hypothetical protein